MFASSQRRWLVVVAAMLGLIVGCPNITVYSFAVLIKPVSTDLGIAGTAIASAIFIANMASGACTPIVGLLADRFGNRAVLLVGVPGFAISIFLLTKLDPSPVTIYVLFGLAGAFGSFQNTALYAGVVSRWFDQQRGLALGVATTGYGIGIVLVPQITSLMVDAHGWRAAYLTLAIAILVLALLPIVVLIRDPRPGEAEAASPKSAVGGQVDLTFAQALWSRNFWLLCFIYAIGVMALNGTVAHLLAISAEKGPLRDISTVMIAEIGIAVVLGRLISGYCLDHFPGRFVGTACFMIPALGIALLGTVSGSGYTVTLMLGAALCGAGAGSLASTMAYLATRYFGLRAYGRISGLLFGVFITASGLGPLIYSLSLDRFGNYQPALAGLAIGLALVSLLFPLLGQEKFNAAASKKDKSRGQSVSMATAAAPHVAGASPDNSLAPKRVGTGAA